MEFGEVVIWGEVQMLRGLLLLSSNVMFLVRFKTACTFRFTQTRESPFYKTIVSKLGMHAALLRSAFKEALPFSPT